MITRQRLDIRLHAAIRMLERQITIDDLLLVLNTWRRSSRIQTIRPGRVN